MDRELMSDLLNLSSSYPPIPSLSAIIDAAGNSTRLSFHKLFASLGEQPVLAHGTSPLRWCNSTQPCFLILFDEARKGGKTPAPLRGKAPASASAPRRAQVEISRLEEELRATRDYLQSIIE